MPSFGGDRIGFAGRRGGRSVLTTAPVATADATDARARHAGIAADSFWHHVFEASRTVIVFQSARAAIVFE